MAISFIFTNVRTSDHIKLILLLYIIVFCPLLTFTFIAISTRTVILNIKHKDGVVFIYIL